jgi:hypothetical protein
VTFVLVVVVAFTFVCLGAVVGAIIGTNVDDDERDDR